MSQASVVQRWSLKNEWTGNQEDDDVSYEGELPNWHRHRLIVSGPAHIEDIGFQRPARIYEIFADKGSEISVSSTVSFEASEEQIEYIETSLAGIYPWANLIERVEDDEEGFRGVLALSYPMQVISKKRVRVNILDLPKWKPFINLEDQAWESDDE